MRTFLIHGADEPPRELRAIVEAGSTELRDAQLGTDTHDADCVVVWRGDHVLVDEQRLRWPDDRDELRMLFQSAG